MLSGIILAGGQSIRNGGENKSFLMFGEEALIQRQVRRMKEICDEVIIVTNTPKAYLRKVDESVRIITDFVSQRGPLSGIHAGLSLSRNKNAWIVGYDMPFISPAAAELLLRKKQEHMDAVIPRIQGSLYPLHGLFDRNSVKPIWDRLMLRDTSLQWLERDLVINELSDTDFQIEGISKEFVTSIKTREDYYGALAFIEGTRRQDKMKI